MGMILRLCSISAPFFLSVILCLGSSAAPLKVFVSIPPHQYLVERVGGDHVEVHVLIQPGQQPHSFEPTPRQVVELGSARIFFKADLQFEQRILGKIQETHKHLSIVDVTEGIEKRPITRHSHHEEGQAVDDSHADEGEPDPHVWLSPPLLKTQSRNIAEALQRIDPINKEDYAGNLKQLLDDIQRIHKTTKETLEPYKGEVFYVFHPAFGYFADAYGLEQRPVEIGGKAPTPKQLAEFIQKAKQEQAEIIFVQPQFDQRTAQTIADAINGSVVAMDPLEKNVLENIRKMATKIRKALER